MKLKGTGVTLRLLWPEFEILEWNKRFLLADMQRWKKFRFRVTQFGYRREFTHAYFYADSWSLPK